MKLDRLKSQARAAENGKIYGNKNHVQVHEQ